MSEEPTAPDLVELGRRSVDAFARRDVDATLALYGPDCVWDTSPIGMGIHEGRESVRKFFEDWIGTYEDYDQVLEKTRDLGNGVTFGVILQRGRPVGGSGFVALRYASVATWRNGLIERVTVYTDIDEARAAAERLAEERG
jgi:ketosteroid isomerase-like protein